jgi:uncharacterized protein (DUF2336 family)
MGQIWEQLTMTNVKLADWEQGAALEKVRLTRRIAFGLKNESVPKKRAVIEDLARLLSQDLLRQVREALAVELRSCKYLPYDLAAHIATDVESVAGPFLAETEAFTDIQLAGLVPHLAEHARVTLVRRRKLGRETCQAIVSFATDSTVEFLLENNAVLLEGGTYSMIVDRFSAHRPMMDALVDRADLPISIAEKIIASVSEICRHKLVQMYGLKVPVARELTKNGKTEAIWRQVEKASSGQIHAYVIDLRRTGRLTSGLVLEMARRGCFLFLESSLSLEAGVTLSVARDCIYGNDNQALDKLLQQSGASKATIKSYRQAILVNTKKGAERRSLRLLG